MVVLTIMRRNHVLAFSFFAAIFSSLLWLIYAVAYVQDNTVGIKFSSLGIVDISIYVALVVLPVLVLWMVFGYINQHINNQKTSKALYQLFLQLRKNQEYTDLIARIMLESEQQIKDGFILNRIDILISDMNELIAEIINRAALASRDQIESLWSRVRNGGKWALGKVIIEINQNQPNFQMRLYEKSQNDVVLAGTILEFCARYQNILTLLTKHDGERVFLNVIETGVFGKVFTILAPLADEIRKYREVSFNKSEVNLDFKAPVQERETPKEKPSVYTPTQVVDEKAPEKEKKHSSLLGGLSSKIGSFIKKDKEQPIVLTESNARDPFSIALERSFGSNKTEKEEPLFATEEKTPIIELPNEEDEIKAPEIVIASSQENENNQELIISHPAEQTPPSFGMSVENELDIKPEPISVPITNTQKTLNDLRKEWENMKKSSFDEKTSENKEPEKAPSFEEAKEEVLSYPFGGWTDESNYHK